MMPAVAKRKLAQFVDVFCDRGAFTRRDHDRFSRSPADGLEVRAHWGNSVKRGLEPFLRFEPTSLDHMDYVNDADLPALAQSDTIATLVPGANYFLGLASIRRAKVHRRRVAVALATTTTRVVPDAQHADGDVVGLHAHEDVARRKRSPPPLSTEPGRCGWPIVRARSNRARMRTWPCLTSKTIARSRTGLGPIAARAPF